MNRLQKPKPQGFMVLVSPGVLNVVPFKFLTALSIQIDCAWP